MCRPAPIRSRSKSCGRTAHSPERRDRMAGRRARQRLRADAFAKINLNLRVLGLRPDGYHELYTTFQTIAVYDTLTLASVDGPFEIGCNDPACPLDGTNL